MKTQVLEIQTGRTGLQKRIEAVQGDSGRTLKCIITDMTIPAGAVARIYAVKPSGSEVYNDCTISENTVEIELTTQLLAETDITRCQVQISYIGKTVTSFEFAIDVKRSLISGSAIESTDEFTALEAALQQAQGLNAPVFTEAATREDIQSGDTLSTLFGKIKKWFTDLGTAAFCTVINNLTATQAGGVLDARQGVVINTTISNLSQSLTQLNSNMSKWHMLRQTVTVPGGATAVNINLSDMIADCPVIAQRITNTGSVGVAGARAYAGYATISLTAQVSASDAQVAFSIIYYC
ncbi:hypothetical protein [Muricomes intestini]|uniref:hypothetical protein n=1 Tax=Muricomes intestini TaxID=1796634 RepID=UPI002FD983CC